MPPFCQESPNLGPSASRTILPPPWHTQVLTKPLSTSRSPLTHHLEQEAGEALGT